MPSLRADPLIPVAWLTRRQSPIHGTARCGPGPSTPATTPDN